MRGCRRRCRPQVAHRIRAPRGVDPARVHGIVDRFRKRDLRDLDRPSVHGHFGVDVRGAALVPARVDRGERHLAAGVRRLDAAQERGGGLRAVLRVVACRIDVPDLHVGIRDRRARAVDVDDLDGQRQHCSALALADVAAEEVRAATGTGPTVSVGVTAQAAFVVVVGVVVPDVVVDGLVGVSLAAPEGKRRARGGADRSEGGPASDGSGVSVSFVGQTA